MRLLYITAVWSGNGEPTMHSDFVDAAYSRGHDVTVLALCEKRNGIPTSYREVNGIRYLSVRCGNIQKTNKYHKVISSLTANYHILRMARKYLNNQRFDVVVWSVSSTLMYVAIKYLTKRVHARQYLLLKEYWPQDPIDLGALSPNGIIARFLRLVEQRMLRSADKIGASSPGGIRYVDRLYPKYTNKCEVCPHCEKIRTVDRSSRTELLASIGVPADKTVFLYGGNFGVSQGIDDMIACVTAGAAIEGTYFLMIGSGTEYDKVKNALAGFKNVKFRGGMGYSDFLRIASVCDCGMIFLYKNYTVPNIPGKLNTYLNAEIPIIACVDKTTDAGQMISDAGAGIAVPSGNVEAFCTAVRKIMDPAVRNKMGQNAKQLLINNFSASHAVSIVETAVRRMIE